MGIPAGNSGLLIDVGGAVTVGVSAEAGQSLARSIGRAFAPYPLRNELELESDVSIRPRDNVPAFRDIEGDAGDGLVTAFDGELTYIIRGRYSCAVPDPVGEAPAVFAYTPGFPVPSLIRSYIRPVVAIAALRREAVVVHASAVSLNGRAILVGGWSESGKTEIALALAEAGAAFISDKWTILRADGSICPFPATVGIRRWVLPYLPTLRARLPKAARAQLLGAAAVSMASRPFRSSSRNGLLREAGTLSARLVAMADRAALSVEQVRAAYGSEGDATTPVPLGLFVMLSTVASDGDARVTTIEPTIVARRLAQSAAFERRAYFSVTERVRYGGAGTERNDGRAVASLEASILQTRLARTRVLEVRTPFPSDPRPTVERILRALETP